MWFFLYHCQFAAYQNLVYIMLVVLQLCNGLIYLPKNDFLYSLRAVLIFEAYSCVAHNTHARYDARASRQLAIALARV